MIGRLRAGRPSADDSGDGDRQQKAVKHECHEQAAADTHGTVVVARLTDPVSMAIGIMATTPAATNRCEPNMPSTRTAVDPTMTRPRRRRAGPHQSFRRSQP